MSRKVSESTVRRLSHYLRILEKLEANNSLTVSSVDLAEEAGTTAAQVRKDFSHFGSFGKRGTGYLVTDLATEIREILGLGTHWNVALVGAGRVGSALFEYADFRRRGFRIETVLDIAPDRVGQWWGEVQIENAADLERILTDRKIDIVILAVPADAAQETADRAVAAGVRGILNFAPTQLRLPAGVSIQDVNMVMELEALSFDLTHEGDDPGPDSMGALAG